MTYSDPRPGAQNPILDFEPDMDRYAGLMSPAEAEFAYEGERGKENKRPGDLPKPLMAKHDSPLDVIAEERSPRPLVSPIDMGFPLPSSPQRPAGSLGFHGRQLSRLDEEPVEVMPIFVKLKTNVIVKDEFRLVTELSLLLARLYFCTQDGIVVDIDHSACLMLAASFDPAYTMSVATTSSQLEMELNGTNAASLQQLMQNILKVPSYRGIIRFQQLLEEDIGFHGTTVAHLNNRTAEHLFAARHASIRDPVRGQELTGLGINQNANPDAPTPFTANHVLRQQISSMTEAERKHSVRGEIYPSINGDMSPQQIWESPASFSQDKKEHKRRKSDAALDFHRPRPMSTYSTREEEQIPDWRPTVSSHGRDRDEDARSTKSRGGRSFRSLRGEDEVGGMMPPPPIGQGKGEKIARRRSLFAVFKR